MSSFKVGKSCTIKDNGFSNNTNWIFQYYLLEFCFLSFFGNVLSETQNQNLQFGFLSSKAFLCSIPTIFSFIQLFQEHIFFSESNFFSTFKEKIQERSENADSLKMYLAYFFSELKNNWVSLVHSLHRTKAITEFVVVTI